MPRRPYRARPLSARVALFLILIIGILPTPAAYAAEPLGKVAIVVTTEGDSLAVRAGPGREYVQLASLVEGTVVAVLDGPMTAPDGAEWYRVTDGQFAGWSVAEFLAPTTGTPGAAPPPAAPGAVRIGGTGGAGARLRDAPGLATAIVLVIPEGAVVDPAGATQRVDDFDWAPVRYGETSGWVVADFLNGVPALPTGGEVNPGEAAESSSAAPTTVSSTPAPTPVPAGLSIGDHAAVTEGDGLDLRVRASARDDSPIHAHVPTGAVVRVVDGPRRDRAGIEWYGIDYDGVQGWLPAEHLTRTDVATSRRPLIVTVPPPPPPPAPPVRPAAIPTAPAMPGPLPPGAAGDRGRAIVAEAMRYLNTPYVWAGASPAGWDCSGMTMWLYGRVAGVTLPRTAQQQFAIGTAVPANEVRAGDLVFFANTAGPGITHNGIALGDGRFIHARSEQFGTTITSFSDPYWAAHYAGARRP